MKTKRFLLPACLILCVCAMMLMPRKPQLRVTLVAEDESLFAGLNYEGVVRDQGNRMSYSFSGNANARFDPWDDGYRDVYWPFVDETEVELTAFEGVRQTRIENEGSPRRRVYADTFEVDVLVPYLHQPVKTADKLYLQGSEDVFIDIFDEGGTVIGKPGPALMSYVEINGTTYFVPAYEGLYGRTCVYAADLEMANEDNVVVREVFPIELSKGEGGILGFIRQEGFLLVAVRRGEQIELTSILPEAGRSVSLPGGVSLTNWVKESNMMLFWIMEGRRITYRTVDVKEMRILAEGNAALFQSGVEDDTLAVHAFLLDGERIYIASEELIPHIGVMDFRRRIYITALDLKGNRLGRAELLTGVEEDPDLPYEPTNHFWQDSRKLESLRLIKEASK